MAALAIQNAHGQLLGQQLVKFQPLPGWQPAQASACCAQSAAGGAGVQLRRQSQAGSQLGAQRRRQGVGQVFQRQRLARSAGAACWFSPARWGRPGHRLGQHIVVANGVDFWVHHFVTLKPSAHLATARRRWPTAQSFSWLG